tara:strand:- start:214 stop:606 length:393 start_codon:yes stop_codon:yes gene_type:complete
MRREQLAEMYKKYNLTNDDVFKHQHYIIITRAGIEKVQAIEKIDVTYDVVTCEPNFAGIKAFATLGGKTVETYGSAYKGKDFKSGNTNSWYVLEMAEKRAMSRAILKCTGMYKLGFMGEEESEDFKRKSN